MRIKIMIALVLTTMVVKAQEFQGKATYKTHRKLDVKIGDGSGAPNDELQKKIQAQLQKQFQKTYILNFTKSESTFKQDEELSAPQVSTGGFEIHFAGGTGGSDVVYKDIANKKYVNKTEISGKRFLIKDKLPDYNWELSGETKNIGNYTCYKATRKREETRKFFKMSNGEQEEISEKVTVETVAWYTTEIPVSAGPELYWGLPGLILEIQDGDYTIACSEIVLNPEKKIEIGEPTKGKVVTQEKFDKIMDDHTKEMMERFKNNRGGNKGDGITIQIGG